MSLPVPDTNIVYNALNTLIPAFQKPNIQAVLAGPLQVKQKTENAITDPATGYLYKIQLANAETDALNKYGKIVNYPRGSLSNDEYRIFIQIKIAVDSSDSTGDMMLNILALATDGPNFVLDMDNYGFGSAWRIVGGYTAFPQAYIALLPAARGGGVYATFVYWTWPVNLNAKDPGLFYFASPDVFGPGFKDGVSMIPTNGLASGAIV